MCAHNFGFYVFEQARVLRIVQIQRAMRNISLLNHILKFFRYRASWIFSLNINELAFFMRAHNWEIKKPAFRRLLKQCLIRPLPGLLALVKLRVSSAERYPHQLTGQRRE